jgi:hypothetical protein
LGRGYSRLGAGLGKGAESAGTSKEVDCFNGAPEKTKPAGRVPGGL